MNIKREISSEELEAAINNRDNINILKKMGMAYSNRLSPDELKNCADLAIWKTLQSHKNNRGQKFTSSLVNFFKWECLLVINFLNRHRAEEMGNVEPEWDSSGDTAHEEVKDLLSLLNDKEQQIIKDRYIDGMSMRDVAQKHGMSRQWARILCMRGFKKIRENFVS